MKNNNNLAYFILILTTIFWSGNFIVGKAASIYEIPPFSLNFYRWFFAGLILLPFTFREIFNNKKYILQNIGFFIILGVTSITIFNSIVYYSLYYTQVIGGILMISTIPVWIIFISSFLNIEKTNIFQLLGVVLSLTGVIFIITKADINLIKNLVDNAKFLLDGLPDHHDDEWLGFRPTLPDYLPVIGPSKNYNNVFYSFGHHHLGWTLAAISGKIISKMISNENTNLDLKPYSSLRFS